MSTARTHAGTGFSSRWWLSLSRSCTAEWQAFSTSSGSLHACNGCQASRLVGARRRRRQEVHMCKRVRPGLAPVAAQAVCDRQWDCHCKGCGAHGSPGAGTRPAWHTWQSLPAATRRCCTPRSSLLAPSLFTCTLSSLITRQARIPWCLCVRGCTVMKGKHLCAGRPCNAASALQSTVCHAA